MKSSLALVLALLPVVASAQTDPGDLRLSDGLARIDESVVSDPDLNVEACFAELAERITIDVTYTGTSIFIDDAKLRVWFESSSETDCVGQIPGDGEDDYIGAVLLDADDSFLTSNTIIRIPDDLEDAQGAVPVLDTHSLLDMRNACPEGVNETMTVCIGLDDDEDGSIDEGVTFEPHGWVRFSIDTERPPKPDTPGIRPLDGRLSITAKVSAEGDKDDIREYQAFLRPQPTDEAAQGVACDEWGDVSGLRTGSTNVTGGDSATFEVSATNGTTYEVCVYAIDDVGNFSEPSDLATGTPQQECDFIECYPDGLLEPGCRATGGAPLVGLFVLLLALRRARERR
jgi:hypothetical protein